MNICDRHLRTDNLFAQPQFGFIEGDRRTANLFRTYFGTKLENRRTGERGGKKGSLIITLRPIAVILKPNQKH